MIFMLFPLFEGCDMLSLAPLYSIGDDDDDALAALTWDGVLVPLFYGSQVGNLTHF